MSVLMEGAYEFDFAPVPKFMADRKLVAENQIPFYARWASKFIRFSNDRQSTPFDLNIQLFLDHLKKNPKIQDWQVTQAQNAVKLYTDHFPSGKTSMPASPSPETGMRIFPDAAAVQRKIREALRIKHYAYSTERTYTDWFQRFHDYLTKIKKKDWESKGADEDDVRDLLSHLAIKGHVSSSTQNQAFNALLFLFRYVLQKDLKDMSKTVRAKRGPNLPAVLSVDEVRQLLSHLSGRDLLVIHVLYGTGMRLMEVTRLRVNDVDFSADTIFVRGGKGDKDRTTVLPQAVIEPLKAHLEGVREMHAQDLAKGFGDDLHACAARYVRRAAKPARRAPGRREESCALKTI